MTDPSKGKLHISVISNVVFDPYFKPFIETHFSNWDAVICPVPYNEHLKDEYSNNLAKSDMIVVWLNFESLYPSIFNLLYSEWTREKQLIDEITALCEKLYFDISSLSSARIYWFSFEDYFLLFPYVMGHNPFANGLVDKINICTYEFLSDKVLFINLKRLIAKIGIANAYDSKGKYRWNAPYSKTLIKAVVKEIHKQYLIENGVTSKCLVLDCDNVLWGGILSEDGVENIKLGGGGFGRAFQDFQRFVLSMHYHGVILAICSKNNLSDVINMFQNHSEMILHEKHIACFQVNWENKPDNIKKIAELLNIGLDSMVFVDDSQIEIEAVKAMLPKVTAILNERDTIYKKLSCFNLKRDVNKTDIEKRNETFKTNQSREILKSQYDSYSDYINALEIKMEIHEALPIEFSRISELTQRTNKCTNGKRYNVTEIKKQYINGKAKLYSISISDRFSDLGLVGAMEVEKNTLTLFSLSCRALGRNIELKMRDFVLKSHNICKVIYSPTGNNSEFITLFNTIQKMSIIVDAEGDL